MCKHEVTRLEGTRGDKYIFRCMKCNEMIEKKKEKHKKRLINRILGR